MKAKLKIYLLNIILVLALASCKKDKDDGLTKETQIGANTFSCKINGTNFFPAQNLFSPKPIFATYNDGKYPYFMVSGRNFSKDIKVEIEMKIYGVLTVGTYQLNDENIATLGYRYIDNDVYTTTKNNTGEITFTRVDHQAKIYSGRFSFSGINPAGNVNHITRGRFDVKL